jgi:uncharacterized membrane protein
VATEQQVYEARREAAPPLLLVAALLVLLALVSEARGWDVLYLPWWSWLAPAVAALVLIGDLWTGTSGPTLVTSRPLAFALLLFVVGGNLVALGFLIAGLVDTKRGQLSGGELLLTAAVIWITNVVAFGLLFWEVADAGPVERRRDGQERRDFQFPQDDGASAWRPRVWDYLYVSLTNSIAFSPTDALPLTMRAKGLMAAGSLISVVTVLLVGARAVNVLGT